MRQAVKSALRGPSSLSLAVMLAGLGVMAIATAAHAQDSTSADAAENAVGADEEIIVTARRREESVQDVPLVVNVLSGNQVEKLNITRFEDIKNVVPGLSLQSTGDGFSFRAALRGVGYDSVASVPANVEFYINEALVSPFALFQSMYDIGQIEVLRGPQGTLRGRAAPSGSITVTTRQPDMDEAGLFFNGSATDKHAYNASAGFNIPLIKGVAALRLAGLIDYNDNNLVGPVSGFREPFSRTESGRVTLALTPADWLDANVMYQVLHRDVDSYQQVESAGLAVPTTPLGFGSNVLIRPEDRFGIADRPVSISEVQKLLIGRLNARFAGQQLSYVGSRFEVSSVSTGTQDPANLFPAQSINQIVPIDSVQTTHEIRLASQERVFGIFDYTVGAFFSRIVAANPVQSPQVLAFNGALPPGIPGLPLYIDQFAFTIEGTGRQTERSYFGNLTAHLGENTELSGGVRRISVRDVNRLAIPAFGLTLSNVDKEYSATVYNVSIKHRFNESIMAYASMGSSWRKGTSAVGVFRPQTGLLGSFLNPSPETSKSYEIGVKTSLFDHKLNLNITGFYQKFDGFLYRNPSTVNYVNLANPAGSTTDPNNFVLGGFNFLANVPAESKGVEIEANYRPSDRFYLNAQFAYAKSRITGGLVACNLPGAVTALDIFTLTGGQPVGTCTINDRLSTSPDWSVTLQSEYNHPISDRVQAYIRGLLTYNPDNPNDPTNRLDDIPSYALLNLYLGVRAEDGAWEIGAFAKNLTNTFRVLSRSDQVIRTSVAADFGFATPPGAQLPPGNTFAGNYRGISTTASREFGISARFSFGSR